MNKLISNLPNLTVEELTALRSRISTSSANIADIHTTIQAIDEQLAIKSTADALVHNSIITVGELDSI